MIAALTAAIWKEPDGFVSLCPELNVASCGDSVEDALAMLTEAVELYLQNAAELGWLDDLRPMLGSSLRLSTTFEVSVP